MRYKLAYRWTEHNRPHNWSDADYGVWEGPLDILLIPDIPSKSSSGIILIQGVSEVKHVLLL